MDRQDKAAVGVAERKLVCRTRVQADLMLFAVHENMLCIKTVREPITKRAVQPCCQDLPLRRVGVLQTPRVGYSKVTHAAWN